MEIYFHDVIIENNSSNPQSDFPDKTFIQIFGSKSDGTPVFVEVKNFKTWFFLEPQEDEDPKELIKKFKDCFWFKNVTKCEVVFRKRLVGFSDNELFPYIYMEFGGVVPLFCARKRLKADFDITKIYEDKIDPILKFLHYTGLKPSSYFGIKHFSEKYGEDKKTHCKHEYYVSIENVFPMADNTPPPMKICAYDIESSGLNPRTESVFQVSMCFSKLGDNVNSDLHASEACKDGVVICVGETESIDGTPILSVESEKDLLEKFRDTLIENNVMIMVGYNNYQFDAKFLYKRAVETYSFNDYRKLGFKKEELLELKETVLASSALGRTELSKVTIPGRVEIDLLMVLRRTYKLKSYKLNSVSEHFFGGHKDDVTYTDILEAYNTKDPHKLGVIAKYCFQDSWLCIRLLDKIKEVYNSIEMAKLCSVPFLWIMSRGQQIKCMSLILSKVYKKYVCNYIAPSEIKEGDGEGFKGATVINAKTGFYPDDPILTLDFASLYPSIMRWKQLCYTTYVNEDKYRNIEGVIYENYETKEGNFDTFAYRKGQKSILCLLEDELIDARKATKKLMKTENDPFKYGLLDSKQLAQKVTCNSLYGFTGTTTGMLPLKAIAAAVTCTGRKMIDQSSELAEKMGATTIYGDTDSIMVTYPTPKEIMDKGETAMMKFLFKKGEEMSAEITNLFGHPVLMEFENIYTRYLLVSKKRYAALSWLTPEGPPKMSSKGLVTVRRDNAPIVRSTATEVLRLLLEEKKNEDDIIKYIKSVLDDLEKGKIPIQELAITKELTRWEYKNPVPHSILAMNMIERAKKQRFYREIIKPIYEETVEFDEKNLRKISSKISSLYQMIPKGDIELSMEDFMVRLRDGILSQLYPDNVMIKECEALCRRYNKESILIEFDVKNSFEIAEFYSDYSTFDIIDWESPRLGDRISYVVKDGKGDINNRVELPEYVDKMPNLKTDTHYYINRQLKNPISDFLNLFIKDKSKLDFFKEYERRALNKSRGIKEISCFFSPVAKKSKI